MISTTTSITTREELLGLIGRGDRAAFAELYDQLSPRVLGVARHCLVDHSQAEEVVQDVFLDIWRNAAHFDPDRGTALAWILTIGHRRVVDRVRSSQSSRDRDRRAGLRQIGVEYDEVWENAEVRFEFARASRAMARLSRLQHQAISLCYFEGYSQRETAAILGISVGTTKTRIRDGLVRLRAELEAG